MAKHIMALTYAPKIEAVRSGECCQTVRLLHQGKELPDDIRERIMHPGDEILMHTWEGRPYRSKWGWRQRYIVDEVLVLYCDGEDTWYWSPLDPTQQECHGLMDIIDDDELVDIVRRDHIDPPTVDEWEWTLLRLNGLDYLSDSDWQVIRWRPARTDTAEEVA